MGGRHPFGHALARARLGPGVRPVGQRRRPPGRRRAAPECRPGLLLRLHGRGGGRPTASRRASGLRRVCRDRGLGPGPGRAVRFRIPEGRTEFDDLVRGHVAFDNDNLGGDFVIVKANGGAVFYLANTVDDLDEGITHVLRGEEHLPNTPKNQLLWEALGDRPPPVWAHLPLLVNEQRKKLSKRRDQVSLESLPRRGIRDGGPAQLPVPARVGTQGRPGFLTLDEMVAEFRIEDVGSSPAFFDVKKLTAFNEHYIRQMTAEAFIAACAPFLDEGPGSPKPSIPPVFARIAPDVQPRIKTLSQVPAMVDFLFLDAAPIDPAAWQKGVAGYPPAESLLTECAAGFGSCEWVERRHQSGRRGGGRAPRARNGQGPGADPRGGDRAHGGPPALARDRGAGARPRARPARGRPRSSAGRGLTAATGRVGGARRRILVRLVAVLLVAGCLYVGVTFVQVWFASRLDQARPVQAIIVLGAAQYDGRPSPVLAARLDHALALWQRHLATVVVVTGGKEPGDRFTEATASANYLEARGVPDPSILREVAGRDSWESLAASAAFLTNAGSPRCSSSPIRSTTSGSRRSQPTSA